MKAYMKTFLKRLVNSPRETKHLERLGKFDASTDKNQKAIEAIHFTIQTYGETFRDLARYDRGEPFSR